MKRSRLSATIRQNASKLHKKIGQILTTDTGGFFGLAKVYQEYPVHLVQPNYANKRHKFDWVILSHRIVIECHGEQHYRAVGFGGEVDGGTLYRQQIRDLEKCQAAEAAGFTYIVVPFWDYDKVDAQYLYEEYKRCYNSTSAPLTPKPEESQYLKDQKLKARQYRKTRYHQLKKLKQRRLNNGMH